MDFQQLSLIKYFQENPEQWKRVESFLNDPDGSLRLLDFFVTCYARKHSCEYTVGDGERFNVYHSMQSLLLGINKKLMDPFKRGKNQFDFKGVTTNVAQLNFFRWCVIYNVLDYVLQFKEDIRREMHEINHKSPVPPAPEENPVGVMVALPPKIVATETPKELKRTITCLREKMYGPKKRRRRLVPEKKKGTFSTMPVKISGSLL